MIKNRKEIIITTILLILFTGLICFNYFSYKTYEETVMVRIERHKVLEAQQQEKQAARQATLEFIKMRELTRDQDIKDIVLFDEKYSGFKKQYLSDIGSISKKLEEKVVNIDDMIALADERIGTAKRFKDSIEGIKDIPAPVEDFYSLVLSFLDNDILTWQQTASYYSGDFRGDEEDIKELHKKNEALYQQVIDLQKEIYSRYNLEYLL